MNIRQIALVANELGTAQRTLFRLLGIERGFHDPGVAEFGLRNAVMRIGDSFLEVVSPDSEGTTAGRYLARRGGDSGYMVLLQVDALAPERARLEAQGVRIVWSIDLPEASAVHLHPADVPGAIVSLDEMRPPDTWHWGGEEGGYGIPAARHASAIRGVEIESANPDATARQWGTVLDCPVSIQEAVPALVLASTWIRFVQEQGRTPGLRTLYLDATDLAAVRAAADELQLEWQDGAVEVCGTVLRFG